MPPAACADRRITIMNINSNQKFNSHHASLHIITDSLTPERRRKTTLSNCSKWAKWKKIGDFRTPHVLVVTRHALDVLAATTLFSIINLLCLYRCLVRIQLLWIGMPCWFVLICCLFVYSSVSGGTSICQLSFSPSSCEKWSSGIRFCDFSKCQNDKRTDIYCRHVEQTNAQCAPPFHKSNQA